MYFVVFDGYVMVDELFRVAAVGRFDVIVLMDYDLFSRFLLGAY